MPETTIATIALFTYVLSATTVLLDTYLWFEEYSYPTLGDLLARVLAAFVPPVNTIVALIVTYDRLDRIRLK